MKRWVATTAAAGLLFALAGGGEAQRPALSRADLAVYVGGSWTSPWLEGGDGSSYGIGFNPAFGGFTQYWWTPRFGTRLHLAFLPSDLPQVDPVDAVAIADGQMHNWFYDLSLAFRPFAGSGWLSGSYLYFGGGGLTASVRIEPPPGGRCVPPYDFGDACLPYDWREATVGQAVAGVGIPFVPLTSRISLFTEAGVHLFSSPMHRGERWTGLPECPNPACRTEDRMGVSTRLVGGFLVALGAPRPTPIPVPGPPVFPEAPPPLPDRPITLCVVADGLPRYVEAFVRPQEGDTVVVTAQGVRRPLRAAYPSLPPSATGRTWFVRDEPIYLNGREFVRFGVPRVLEPERLQRAGEYQGVPLFTLSTETPAGTQPTRIYVPVNDGCIYQPYQHRDQVQRVRG